MKTCINCEQEKELSSFGIHSKRKDGTPRYRNVCIDCRKDQQAKSGAIWHQKNKDKVKKLRTKRDKKKKAQKLRERRKQERKKEKLREENLKKHREEYIKNNEILFKKIITDSIEKDKVIHKYGALRFAKHDVKTKSKKELKKIRKTSFRKILDHVGGGCILPELEFDTVLSFYKESLSELKERGFWSFVSKDDFSKESLGLYKRYSDSLAYCIYSSSFNKKQKECELKHIEIYVESTKRIYKYKNEDHFKFNDPDISFFQTLAMCNA